MGTTIQNILDCIATIREIATKIQWIIYSVLVVISLISTLEYRVTKQELVTTKAALHQVYNQNKTLQDSIAQSKEVKKPDIVYTHDVKYIPGEFGSGSFGAQTTTDTKKISDNDIVMDTNPVEIVDKIEYTGEIVKETVPPKQQRPVASSGTKLTKTIGYNITKKTANVGLAYDIITIAKHTVGIGISGWSNNISASLVIK